MAKKTIEELAFILTQHADDLQLFANGLAEDAVDDFSQTEAAILELIVEMYLRYKESGVTMDYRTVQWLEGLRAKLIEIRESIIEYAIADIERHTRDAVKNESKFLRAFWLALTGNVAIALTPAFYDKVSKYGIYNGDTRRQMLSRLITGDVNRVYETAVRSLIDGRPLEDVRAIVRREMDKTNRYVKIEAEAVVNGVINDTTLAFAEENKTRLLYNAVLDERTCEECESFNNKVFDYDDEDLPSLPRHVRCRCFYVPIPDDGRNYNGLSMDFNSYLAVLPSDKQMSRLGNDKYDLWQARQYDLRDYETPMRGQRLSIEDLRERDKTLFV